MTRDEQMNAANPYPRKATVPYALVRNDAFSEGWKAADATPSEDVPNNDAETDEMLGTNDVQRDARALADAFNKARTDGWTCYCPIDPAEGYLHREDCPASIAERILKEEV